MSISNEEKTALLIELDRRLDVMEESIRDIERDGCIATLICVKVEMQSEIAKSIIGLCIKALEARG